MSCARVYHAINLVSGEIALIGVPKSHTNSRDNYQYRSIDDVVELLAPILAKQKLCVLPRVLKRTVIDRQSEQDVLISVALKVAFDLASAEDGSIHTVVAYGEALDAGDKATAKAMSSAYKAAMVQTFCIPLGGNADADESSHRLTATPFLEPEGGWTSWSQNIRKSISICESEEALQRVQKTHRNGLISLKREQPSLYGAIGSAFAARKTQLRPLTSSNRTEDRPGAPPAKRQKRTKRSEDQSNETAAGTDD